jgi:hypothetical protein
MSNKQKTEIMKELQDLINRRIEYWEGVKQSTELPELRIGYGMIITELEIVRLRVDTELRIEQLQKDYENKG